MSDIIKSFLGADKKISYPSSKKNFKQLKPLAEVDGKSGVKPLKAVEPSSIKLEPISSIKELKKDIPTNLSTEGKGGDSTKTVPTVTVPNASNVPNTHYNYYGAEQYGYHGGEKKFIEHKPLVNVKMTVFLVENTKEVVKLAEELAKAITPGNSEYVCIINYGLVVRKGEVIKASNFDANALFYKSLAGDDVSLFEALSALDELVKECYQKVEETPKEKRKIDKIDIIGIGRCFDNSSVTSREEAKKIISKISKYKGVNTKYCCLREEYFIETAAMGFRSIVSIDRNYM